MMTLYTPLAATPLEAGVSIHQLDRLFSDVVTLDDLATVVMTDLR